MITVIGSYAIGLTMKTKRFPTRGETLIGGDFNELHGGKGSNQAIVCSRLGEEVNLAAFLGKDNYGSKAVDLFQSEGVGAELIRFSKKLPTGVGFIMVDKAGDNIILLDPGANGDLLPGYINEVKPAIIDSELIIMQMEIPIDSIMEAVKIAAENGVRTLLNPAPYKKLSEEVFPLIDIVTPNEKEAKLMLSLSPEDDITYEELAEMLRNKGLKNVVITLGEMGSYVASDDFTGHMPPRKVEAVDTTGAGDTFTAALGVGLCKGMSIAEAAEFANIAASVTVTKYGVVESLPYGKDIKKILEQEGGMDAL